MFYQSIIKNKFDKIYSYLEVFDRLFYQKYCIEKDIFLRI